MISEVLPALKDLRIILASGSPRRRDILNKLGLHFEVVVSNFAEDLDKSLYVGRPEAYVTDNARIKAMEVYKKLSDENQKPDLIIGGDTVVALDGQIIEKPEDEKHAFEMLKKMSGREHAVYTGVALVQSSAGEPKITEFHEKSSVRFGNLSDKLIQAYVDTKEPLDKAGGYGIQRKGAILVEGIVGDYYNVEGLPLFRLSTFLQKLYD